MKENIINDWLLKNQNHEIEKQVEMEAEQIMQNQQLIQMTVMPRSLTAENGAKTLLSGEFFETVEVSNDEYCGCGECDYCHDFPNTKQTVQIKVPVRWSTIKEIYAKVVSHYGV